MLLSQDGADGASRPAKRGRATVLGADSDEEEGPAGKEKQDTKGEGQGAVEQADQQQQQPDANGVKEEVEGAAGGGGSGAAVKSKGEGGALEGSGPNGGRMIRPVGSWARDICAGGTRARARRCPSNSCGPCPTPRYPERLLSMCMSCTAVSALYASRL